MGLTRQEYWSGLPCPPPGDLPDPGIEPASRMSPALTGGLGSLPLAPPGKPKPQQRMRLILRDLQHKFLMISFGVLTTHGGELYYTHFVEG